MRSNSQTNLMAVVRVALIDCVRALQLVAELDGGGARRLAVAPERRGGEVLAEHAPADLQVRVPGLGSPVPAHALHVAGRPRRCVALVPRADRALLAQAVAEGLCCAEGRKLGLLVSASVVLRREVLILLLAAHVPGYAIGLVAPLRPEEDALHVQPPVRPPGWRARTRPLRVAALRRGGLRLLSPAAALAARAPPVAAPRALLGWVWLVLALRLFPALLGLLARLSGLNLNLLRDGAVCGRIGRHLWLRHLGVLLQALLPRNPTAALQQAARRGYLPGRRRRLSQQSREQVVGQPLLRDLHGGAPERPGTPRLSSGGPGSRLPPQRLH
mmetsp:Transcript_41643/g.124411  ORF Transcript_41643/g.124411 Transcript_41643/m.124411 type:complete len:329 (-) Transcript_41643:68-1054(-)